MPTSQDFDNAAVLASANPSKFGHHHGPVPNLNHDWVPAAVAAALAAGRRAPSVTAAMNTDAPNAGAVMSMVNGLVCMIDVNGGRMCGMTFSDQPTFRRHCRTAHPGALANPSRKNVSQPEEIAGENALKLYVMSQGWRSARFQRDPGRCQPESLISIYATQLETIAATDPAFAAQWGTRFHRDSSLSNHTKQIALAKHKAHKRLTESVLAAVTKFGNDTQFFENPADAGEALNQNPPARGGRKRKVRSFPLVQLCLVYAESV
jgi:hypothetical protein